MKKREKELQIFTTSVFIFLANVDQNKVWNLQKKKMDMTQQIAEKTFSQKKIIFLGLVFCIDSVK